MSDFLAMNGYGGYIWSAYGISIISIVVFSIQSKRKLTKIKTQIQQGLNHHVA